MRAESRLRGEALSGLTWCIHIRPGRLTSRPAPCSCVCRRYGDGSVRLTVEENVVLPNIPTDKLEALQAEPIFQRFPIHGGALPRLPAASA